MIKICLLLTSFMFLISQTPKAMGSEHSQSMNLDSLLENYKRLDGDTNAFFQVMCFFKAYEHSRFMANGDLSNSNGLKIKNKNFITITDLTKPSTTARLFVLNLKTSEVKAYFVAHGVGESNKKVELFSIDKLNNEKKEKLSYPTKISNKPGSNASPHGIFILGDVYYGSFGLSLRIHGLQEGINDNTFSRSVVMHGFKGMNPVVISSNDPSPSKSLNAKGNLALSQGCSMLELDRAKEVINDVKGSSLYYVYTAAEKNESESYCADKNLMLQ